MLISVGRLLLLRVPDRDYFNYDRIIELLFIQQRDRTRTKDEKYDKEYLDQYISQSFLIKKI
uniref:Uncharacterized protein cyl0032 n=1 Tax=Crocosphaera subtropica (strain ATCC 51142 / BH68) TaxID=43989 RepID=A1KYI3_CROS5|nr:hypothetical protein [Crocosphaera subtropica ATCC 51142]